MRQMGRLARSRGRNGTRYDAGGVRCNFSTINACLEGSPIWAGAAYNKSMPPRSTLTLLLRLALASTTFLVLVGGGAWWLLGKPRLAPQRHQQAVQPVAAAVPAPSSFFYNTIGTAPSKRPETAEESNERSSFTLEIKLARSAAEADGAIGALAAKGIEAFYTPVTRNGQVLYRIRRGIFASEKAANHAALAMRQEFGVKAQVVRLQ